MFALFAVVRDERAFPKGRGARRAGDATVGRSDRLFARVSALGGHGNALGGRANVKGRSENARFATSAQTESPPDAHSSTVFALVARTDATCGPDMRRRARPMQHSSRAVGSDRRKRRTVCKHSAIPRAHSAFHRPKRRSDHSPIGLTRRGSRITQETSSIPGPTRSFTDPTSEVP